MPWEPDGPTRARCSDGYDPRRSAPSPGCDCGLWAIRTAEMYLVHGACPSVEGGLWNGSVLFGRVKLWGAVMEYEHGWRSEFAQPVALYRCWSPERSHVPEEVADTYAIPIEDPPEPLASFVAAWAKDVEERDTLERVSTATGVQLQQAQQQVGYPPLLPLSPMGGLIQSLRATYPVPNPPRRTRWDWVKLRLAPLALMFAGAGGAGASIPSWNWWIIVPSVGIYLFGFAWAFPRGRRRYFDLSPRS